MHARADRVTAPRAARAHRNVLLGAGFEEVRTSVLTGLEALLVLTDFAAPADEEGRAADWMAEQRARVEKDRLFVAVPMFVAAATVPVRPMDE
ncbi:hypothetical protein [Streptomyces sp. NPDC001536]|uniref:hypothetical protein n=1 Tax=Streptomyces sp. NPDC001536 TaxID=3364583 RepID=UPI0036ABB281